MECALCGKDFQFLTKAEIENTILEVCEKCLKFGSKIVENELEYKPILQKIDLEVPEKQIKKYREAKV